MEETTEKVEKRIVKDAKWYAVRVVTGKEKQAIEILKSELNINNCDRFVSEILLPIEDEMKLRNGKKVKRSKITIPGYIFIEGKIIGEVERVVRRTNFIADWTRNAAGDPQALRQSEIDRIIGRIEESKKEEVGFMVGEKVIIIDGPFTTFEGEIASVDESKQHLKVNVMVFGRETPVDLSFLQVDRIK